MSVRESVSRVGFSEGGHRVQRDGARLGGEGTTYCLSPGRVPIYQARGALVERHLSPLSPLSPCSKNLPVKARTMLAPMEGSMGPISPERCDDI